MKTITIDLVSDAEVEAFFSHLRRYAGFRYLQTEFQIGINNANYDVDDVIKALNIKNRYKRIQYIYDAACDLIDQYNKKNGIQCQFCNGRCSDERHSKRLNGCCCHCPYQSSQGCTTRNLSCKLYFCEYMKEHYQPISMDDLHLLKLLSRSQQAILRENVFTKRETAIKLLYVGSYIVFGFYSVIQLVRIKF